MTQVLGGRLCDDVYEVGREVDNISCAVLLFDHLLVIKPSSLLLPHLPLFPLSLISRSLMDLGCPRIEYM